MRHLALSLLFLFGCAPEADDDLALEDSEQTLTATPPSIANGTRTTVASIRGAENLLFTRDNRLFVSGDDGVFELQPNGKDSFKTVKRTTASGCSFGGLAEARGTLYVNCNGNGNQLFAAPLVAEPSFVSIGALTGGGNANGLAADDQGRLYVAFTGGDKIARITTAPSNPLAIATQETFQQGSGVLSNGLAQYAGTLFWTDSVVIKRRSLTSTTVTNIVTQFSYFDDLRVDANGILAADFTGGVVRAYDTHGKSLGSTPPFVFNGPTSVVRSNGRASNLDANTLVVTERLGNRVSIYKPR